MKDKRLDQGVIDFIVRELKPEKVIDCESSLVYSELEEILNNQEQIFDGFDFIFSIRSG